MSDGKKKSNDCGAGGGRSGEMTGGEDLRLEEVRDLVRDVGHV